MGEWSKSIGEFGESVIEQFLELIGWGTMRKNLTVPCCYPQKHKRSTAKENRTTHGIDFLFSYSSPLVDRVLDNVVISSKYTTKPYQQNPSTKFKEYLKDIAQTIECFKFSDLRSQTNQEFSVDSVNDVGVIFWLSNDEKSNPDMISKVTNIRNIEDVIFDTVYLVDNMRIAFIYDSIKYLQSRFTDYDVLFDYPRSGKNVDPVTKQNRGKILPVQYINSSILPFRLEKDDEKILVISSIDDFSESYLRRLIGLAQELSLNWINKVLILFPNFNEMEHSQDVQKAKSVFSDIGFVQSISIGTFNPSFRSLS